MQNINFFTLILASILFGLSNGLSPGPSLAMVISHTLHHNLKAGIKVACGPLIFGLIVAPISVYFSIQLDNFKNILGVISIIGAIYIAYLGFKQLLLKKVELDSSRVAPKSFGVGALANFSSPYAYIFWFTVGGPLIVRTSHASWFATILFISVYYFCLIGSKIAVALFVSRFRFLIERWFIYIMRCLGIILLLFACSILKEGLVFLIS